MAQPPRTIEVLKEDIGKANELPALRALTLEVNQLPRESEQERSQFQDCIRLLVERIDAVIQLRADIRTDLEELRLELLSMQKVFERFRIGIAPGQEYRLDGSSTLSLDATALASAPGAPGWVSLLAGFTGTLNLQLRASGRKLFAQLVPSPGSTGLGRGPESTKIAVLHLALARQTPLFDATKGLDMTEEVTSFRMEGEAVVVQLRDGQERTVRTFGELLALFPSLDPRKESPSITTVQPAGSPAPSPTAGPTEVPAAKPSEPVTILGQARQKFMELPSEAKVAIAGVTLGLSILSDKFRKFLYAVGAATGVVSLYQWWRNREGSPEVTKRFQAYADRINAAAMELKGAGADLTPDVLVHIRSQHLHALGTLGMTLQQGTNDLARSGLESTLGATVANVFLGKKLPENYGAQIDRLQWYLAGFLKGKAQPGQELFNDAVTVEQALEILASRNFPPRPLVQRAEEGRRDLDERRAQDRAAGAGAAASTIEKGGTLTTEDRAKLERHLGERAAMIDTLRSKNDWQARLRNAWDEWRESHRSYQDALVDGLTEEDFEEIRKTFGEVYQGEVDALQADVLEAQRILRSGGTPPKELLQRIEDRAAKLENVVQDIRVRREDRDASDEPPWVLCWDACGGTFQTILTAQGTIIAAWVVGKVGGAVFTPLKILKLPLAAEAAGVRGVSRVRRTVLYFTARSLRTGMQQDFNRLLSRCRTISEVRARMQETWIRTDTLGQRKFSFFVLTPEMKRMQDLSGKPGWFGSGPERDKLRTTAGEVGEWCNGTKKRIPDCLKPSWAVKAGMSETHIDALVGRSHLIQLLESDTDTCGPLLKPFLDGQHGGLNALADVKTVAQLQAKVQSLGVTIAPVTQAEGKGGGQDAVEEAKSEPQALEELRSQLAAEREARARVEEQLRTQSTAMEEMRRDLEAKEKVKGAQDGEVKELRDKLAAAEAEQGRLQEEHEQERGRMATAMQELQDELKAQELARGQLEEDLEIARADVALLQQDLGEQQAINGGTSMEVERLHGELTEKVEAYRALQRKHDAALEAEQRARLELQESLEGEIRTLNEKLATMNDADANQQAEIGRLTEQLGKREQELTTLRGEIKRALKPSPPGPDRGETSDRSNPDRRSTPPRNDGDGTAERVESKTSPRPPEGGRQPADAAAAARARILARGRDRGGIGAEIADQLTGAVGAGVEMDTEVDGNAGKMKRKGGGGTDVRIGRK